MHLYFIFSCMILQDIKKCLLLLLLLMSSLHFDLYPPLPTKAGSEIFGIILISCSSIYVIIIQKGPTMSDESPGSID